MAGTEVLFRARFDGIADAFLLDVMPLAVPDRRSARRDNPPTWREKLAIGGPILASCVVCLSLTNPASVRAESPHSDSRTGVTVRVGSVAGTTEFRSEDVITVGAQGAVGYQLGPIALELEHERGVLLEGRTGSTRGRTSRSAINARLFAAKITRPFEPGTLLRLYLEAGTGYSRGTFSAGDKFSRGETSLGGGILLDHRARSRKGGGLHFAGWHLGWSLRMSEPTARTPSFAAACVKRCPDNMPADPGRLDMNLMFGSSINFAW